MSTSECGDHAVPRRVKKDHQVEESKSRISILSPKFGFYLNFGGHFFPFYYKKTHFYYKNIHSVLFFWKKCTLSSTENSTCRRFDLLNCFSPQKSLEGDDKEDIYEEVAETFLRSVTAEVAEIVDARANASTNKKGQQSSPRLIGSLGQKDTRNPV